MARAAAFILLACLSLPTAVWAQGAGGAGSGAGGASATGGSSTTAGTATGATTTGGTQQPSGTTTGGVAEPQAAGTAPNSLLTTGRNSSTITGLPPNSPTELQAERNRGAGTSENGLPIGSPGSGVGSPEQPVGSSRR